MSVVGQLASWAAALFGAWAFIAGLAASTPGHAARRSAERALVASATAAAAATAVLALLLLAGDVTISYVARSVTTNLPVPYRLAALWNLPAGAVLPTAFLVAVAGVLGTRRATTSLGIAATGAIVMALCAASLAATPFAVLPWVPTDGLGLAPALQHPLSVAGRVSFSLAIACGAAQLAKSADALTGVGVARRGAAGGGGLVLLTLTLLGGAMWATALGGYQTGSGNSPAPPTAWGGTLVPATVALAFVWQSRPAGSTAAFTATLGALGLMSAALLGAAPRDGGGWAMTAFAALSLGASAAGAALATSQSTPGPGRAWAFTTILLLAAGVAATLWLAVGGLAWMGTTAQWLLIGGAATSALGARVAEGRGAKLPSFLPPALALGGAALGLWLAPLDSPTLGWSVVAGLWLGVAISRVVARPSLSDRWSRAALALALALAALGAAGEERPLASSATLASGQRTTVAQRLAPPLTLVHQGISRYQDRNAHVVALALEPSRDARPLPLLSVERREYVDSRDEILGPPTSPPAVRSGTLEDVRVHLDDVGADEQVMLRLVVVPFTHAWTLALLLLAAASVGLLVSHLAPAPPPTSVDSVLA